MLSLFLPPFLLCASFFFLLVCLTAPLPFVHSLSLWSSHQEADHSAFLSLTWHLALSRSTSPYCRALMSTLARSVNYSKTERKISHPATPPSLVRSKNRPMLGRNHSQLFDMEMLIVPSWCRAELHVLEHPEIWFVYLAHAGSTFHV